MSNLHLSKSVLLMVGRTGNGKSSTGNYIAGKHLFEVKEGFGESEVNECKTETVEYQGQKVTIVDGVSIYDTDYEDTTRIKKNVQECLVKCGHYVTAVIIVLRYGSRFTNQERQAIQLIKKMFGKKSIKNFGIIIFTFGDNFNEDNSFDHWLNVQQGDFRTLLEEVNYRCVLFDNKHVNDPQNVKKLFEFVKLFKINKPYNRGLFLLHDKLGELAIYKTHFQQIKDDNALSKKLDKTKIEKCIQMLEVLLKELEKFKHSLNVISDTNNRIKVYNEITNMNRMENNQTPREDGRESASDIHGENKSKDVNDNKRDNQKKCYNVSVFERNTVDNKVSVGSSEGKTEDIKKDTNDDACEQSMQSTINNFKDGNSEKQPEEIINDGNDVACMTRTFVNKDIDTVSISKQAEYKILGAIDWPSDKHTENLNKDFNHFTSDKQTEYESKNVCEGLNVKQTMVTKGVDLGFCDKQTEVMNEDMYHSSSDIQTVVTNDILHSSMAEQICDYKRKLLSDCETLENDIRKIVDEQRSALIKYSSLSSSSPSCLLS